MGRHSISFAVFCMVFGLLIGVAGFLSVAYLGGFVTVAAAEAVSNEPDYSSAIERFEAYRCKAAETKMVIMGGIEDGFDPAGDEPITSSENAKFNVKNGNVQLARSYDDPTENRYFSDSFKIPARTFHGIVAIGMEERSKIKNDTISLGYFDRENGYLNTIYYGNTVANINTDWQQDGDYNWSELDALKTTRFENTAKGISEVIGYANLSVLDAIRRDNNRVFEVHIEDDTNVDFIGFAICLEPEEHKGIVYKKFSYGGPQNTFNFGDEFVSLYSSGFSLDGDVFCTEKRPIPCIDDQNLKAPDVFGEQTFGLWSGGNIKFTEAVPGNSFTTEDEVDGFCARQFGKNFRSVNTKDGNWRGAIVGYGDYPAVYDEYWVGVKDSPHLNCWSSRMDYDDVAAAEESEND